MKIYLGRRGPVNSEDCILTVTTNKPDRITIGYKGGLPMVYPHVYSDARGTVADFRGQMDEAAKYAMTVKELQRQTWHEVKTVTAQVDPFEKLRNAQQEAEESNKAKMRAWLRKHGLDKVQTHTESRPNHEGSKSLYHRILPKLHEMGYTMNLYGGDWPNPRYRVIDTAIGDWPDVGPFAENDGVFSLYDLASMIGDPAADDLTRRLVDADTGEVIGIKKEDSIAS